MTKELFFKAILKFSVGLAVVFALIFIPAGTLDYFGGWLLIGVLFIPMLIAGIVMMIKSPEMLKKRLNVKEKQREQGSLIAYSGIMFTVGFVAAGTCARFDFFMLSAVSSMIAAAVLLLAYVFYAEVMRENAYLSRTVEVSEGQKVVSSGLYGIVRHPMYGATVILFLAIPFVLGSIVSLVPFLFYPFIIVKRIKGEEALLERELDGYGEYMKKVKYRLIPFVW